MRTPAISVVVISRDEGAELRRTVENFDDTLPAGSEIVIIDDGSRDGSADRVKLAKGRIRLKRARNLGVARARNAGARLSRGQVIVWADAHIRLERLWWKPLVELLENPKTGAAAPAVNDIAPGRHNGYGLKFAGPSLNAKWLPWRGSDPFPAPILTGCCFAMRSDVFEATGGWDEGMFSRGGVDNEGCVRFWLLGYELMVAPEVLVRHLFRERAPYPTHWEQYLHNRLRLAYAHLNPARLGKVISAQRSYDEFGEAMLLIANSGIAAHRAAMMARRRYGDDWFFERFGMRW